MDGNGKHDSYNINKNRWDYKKNILKQEKNMNIRVKIANGSFSKE